MKEILIERSLLDALASNLQGVATMLNDDRLDNERKISIVTRKIYECRDVAKSIMQMARLSHPEAFGQVAMSMETTLHQIEEIRLCQEKLAASLNDNNRQTVLLEMSKNEKLLVKLRKRVERLKFKADELDKDDTSISTPLKE